MRNAEDRMGNGAGNVELISIDEQQNCQRDSYYNAPTPRRRRIVSDHFLPKNDTDNKKSQRSSKSCLKETTKNGIKSTFFVLAWLAERLPHLVRELQARGHEVASHGYNHELPNSLSPKDLKKDLIDSKKLLEDIIGEAVTGYRAPSFAINDNILKTIANCGYHYDSSYNSFSMHGRYGSISLNGSGRKGIAHKISDNFHELPISNLRLGGLTFPLGGGGYFRLIPHLPFKYGVKSILKKENAYLFFMHPWEIDPEQPRVKEAITAYKFRHYVNLRNTRDKLINLIDAFSQCRFITCSQYLFEAEKKQKRLI